MNLISLSSLFFFYFFFFPSPRFLNSLISIFFTPIWNCSYTHFLKKKKISSALSFIFPSYMAKSIQLLPSLSSSLSLLSFTHKNNKNVMFFYPKKKILQSFLFSFFLFSFFFLSKDFVEVFILLLFSDLNRSINYKKEGLRFLKLDRGQIKVEP